MICSSFQTFEGLVLVPPCSLMLSIMRGKLERYDRGE
jgi:hypothetical protein